jgi:hypothetical protein
MNDFIVLVEIGSNDYRGMSFFVPSASYLVLPLVLPGASPKYDVWAYMSATEFR